MKRTISVKPTKTSLLVGIFVVVFMLIFGIVFFFLLNEDGSEVGRIFLVFWFIVVFAIGGSFVYSYINYDKNNSSGVGQEIQISDELPIQKEDDIAFDEKLRKLERLRSEGLISEKEYTTKRIEILNQKW